LDTHCDSISSRFDCSCAGSTGSVWPGFGNGSSDPESGYSCRRQYHAMVNLLDGVIDQIHGSFVEKGMWDRTLMVFSSDNVRAARNSGD
jgi:hypothetical protein